jgi:hypothetical protein
MIMKVTGRCYCGQVHYEAEGDPMMRAQCHCRECQYITGGGPNFFLAMPKAGFKYTKGEPSSYTRDDIDNPVTREFCPNCGTHLTTNPPGFPAMVIKVGTMDDPTQFGGADVALFKIDMQAFHMVPDGIEHFDRMPG